MWKRYGFPTVYLIIVFVCGILVGSFAYSFYYSKTVSAHEPRPPEEWKKRHLKEMGDRLHLTPEQSAQLSSILDQTRSEYHALMEKTRPDLERIQAEQYAHVKAILTPQQIPAYNTYHAERERQRRENTKGL